VRNTQASGPGTVIIRARGGEEIEWRTQRMLRLGADAELAESVAESDVDVHDIERLLEAGCPLDVAWAIARPATEPQRAVEPAAADEPTDHDSRRNEKGDR
jgi:hypothetical protein